MEIIKTVILTSIVGDITITSTYRAWSDNSYTMERTYYDSKDEAIYDRLSRSYDSFEAWDEAIIENANLINIFKPVIL